ncbi:hypothetical protein [Sphingobium sp.]|uniref:hypothetical protein n=1 Tax=Sphingobium sp. TaxID=1912891 RepID=UPI003BB62FAF
MRMILFILAALAPMPASAQSLAGGTIDASQVASRNDLAAKQAQIDALAAQLAAAQAAIPKPSDAVPSADMMTAGTVGSSLRFRRVDDQAPRLSRTVKQQVTSANGTAVITWAAMPSVPGLTITEYVTANDTIAPSCYPVAGTVTTTGATIKCYVDQSLIGLGLLPRKAAGAGVTFDVLALP